jgi:hypothetical protein
MPIDEGNHFTARAPSARARRTLSTQSAAYGWMDAAHSKYPGCFFAMSRA